MWAVPISLFFPKFSPTSLLPSLACRVLFRCSTFESEIVYELRKVPLYFVCFTVIFVVSLF